MWETPRTLLSIRIKVIEDHKPKKEARMSVILVLFIAELQETKK